MINHYFMAAFRNLVKFKTNSIINIIGIVIGLTCFLLISLWVLDEWSYDRFHANLDRLFRVVMELNYDSGIILFAPTPVPLAGALKRDIPDIENVTRVNIRYDVAVKNEEHLFENQAVAMVDPTFFELFDFPSVTGDSKDLIKDINSVIITESSSLRIFESTDIIGSTIEIGQKPYIVSGILQDVPHNSHLQFDYVINFESVYPHSRYANSWGQASIYTYVLLNSNVDESEVDEKITHLRQQYLPGSNGTLSLQSINRIHLYHDYEDGLTNHGEIKYIYLFSILAVMILVVACINYINMATAHSIKRLKEIGVRKTLGASRWNLIMQFWSESLIVIFIGLIGALSLYELVVPYFADLLGKSSDMAGLGNTYFAVLLPMAFIGTAIMAGVYPAVILSSFKPITLFRSLLSQTSGNSILRKILVIFQITFTIFLIISSIIIYSQVNFISNKDLGFDKDNLIVVNIPWDARNKYNILSNALAEDKNVVNITGGVLPGNRTYRTDRWDYDGSLTNKEISISSLLVHYDFIKTMNMHLVAGSSFRNNTPGDSLRGFILNEKAVKVIGIDDPIGKKMSFANTQGEIIGIVKDFHSSSLYEEIQPAILHMMPLGHSARLRNIIIRLNGKNTPEFLATLKQTWKAHVPDLPLNYYFASDFFNSLYDNESRVGAIFLFFTIIAIFISCLGLFGLISFISEIKSKEIGIRKVLGASIVNIIKLMTMEIIVLIIVASLIACPLAYYSMNKWLENFAYQVNIGALDFFIAVITALLITLLTVGYKVIQTAKANPVDSIRME